MHTLYDTFVKLLLIWCKDIMLHSTYCVISLAICDFMKYIIFLVNIQHIMLPNVQYVIHFGYKEHYEKAKTEIAQWQNYITTHQNIRIGNIKRHGRTKQTTHLCLDRWTWLPHLVHDHLWCIFQQFAVEFVSVVA